MNEKDRIVPGLDGMPPVKDRYEKNEKKILAEAAGKFGTKAVASAYGIKWQSVVAFKKHYCESTTRKEPVTLVIQSPTGQEITSSEIIKKVGGADKIYIRVDENKAYWVRGEDTGAINLW